MAALLHWIQTNARNRGDPHDPIPAGCFEAVWAIGASNPLGIPACLQKQHVADSVVQ